MDKLDEFANDPGFDLVDFVLDPQSGDGGMVCVTCRGVDNFVWFEMLQICFVYVFRTGSS